MIGDLSGKICMVTGATNGIGKQVALELAQMDATVVIVGRDARKSTIVVNKLQAQSRNRNIELMLADFASLESTRALADKFKSRHDQLHILVNNAGALFSKRRLTTDGYEQHFQVNHLGYFLLTNLLLDVLKASAPARIINVSSNAHLGQTISFDDLDAEGRYGMMERYGESKLANILFSYELARRLDGTGVAVNALHPGFVRTGFGKNNGLLMRAALTFAHLFARNVVKGAETVVYLAASPEVAGVSGKYFVDKRAVKSSAASYDESAARRLWDVSAAMTGLAL